jgi:hypothetical protein
MFSEGKLRDECKAFVTTLRISQRKEKSLGGEVASSISTSDIVARGCFTK